MGRRDRDSLLLWTNGSLLGLYVQGPLDGFILHNRNVHDQPDVRHVGDIADREHKQVLKVLKGRGLAFHPQLGLEVPPHRVKLVEAQDCWVMLPCIADLATMASEWSDRQRRCQCLSKSCDSAVPRCRPVGAGPLFR